MDAASQWNALWVPSRTENQTRISLGPEVEFEPGSRGRVLRNLLGITLVSDMNTAESQALELTQDAAVDQYGPNHRFTANDICALHRLWLGPIYPAASTSVRVAFNSRAPRIAG
jgi:hypothetical protein